MKNMGNILTEKEQEELDKAMEIGGAHSFRLIIKGGVNTFAMVENGVHQIFDETYLKRLKKEEDLKILQSMSHEEKRLTSLIADPLDVKMFCSVLESAETYHDIVLILMKYIDSSLLSRTEAQTEDFIRRLQPFCMSLKVEFKAANIRAQLYTALAKRKKG